MDVLVALAVLAVVLWLLRATARRVRRVFAEWGLPASRTRREEEAAYTAAIRAKLPHLRSARQKRTTRWGDLDAQAWDRDKHDFYDTVLARTLRAPRFHTRSEILRMIDQVMDSRPDLQAKTLSGADYEVLCATELRAAGWDVSTTKASGDQGVDLVAHKDALSVALQCKRYAGSVPNSAVQEVAAGAAHYGLRNSAVVSTGRFTPSARSLAQSTGTLLLSHEQLQDLEGLLTRAAARA